MSKSGAKLLKKIDLCKFNSMFYGSAWHFISQNKSFEHLTKIKKDKSLSFFRENRRKTPEQDVR